MLSTPLCYKIYMLHLGRSVLSNVHDIFQSSMVYNKPLPKHNTHGLDLSKHKLEQDKTNKHLYVPIYGLQI